jgi:hypothetical protein
MAWRRMIWPFRPWENTAPPNLPLPAEISEDVNFMV